MEENKPDEEVKELVKKIGDVKLLPLREGVIPVDGWVAEGDDIVFGYCGKIAVVPFDKLFKRKTAHMFNQFFVSYKEAYYKRLDIITQHINYFLKFYDTDRELVSTYLNLKYIVDLKETNIKREAFIDLMMKYIFTDTMVDKIKRMCEDNYRADLTSDNPDKKRYSASLEFNNDHAKILMQISVAIKIMIPIMMHYISINKSKKETNRLHEYFLPLFKILNNDVNILGKLYHSIYAKANVSKKNNNGIWAKHAANGDSCITITEDLLYKNIIVDTLFRYSFIGNIVAFNSVILGQQLGFFSIQDLGVDYNIISTDKDSEGLSSLDKMEMHTTKIDEYLVIFSDVNIENTIKNIRKKLKIDIPVEEVDFYMEYHQINKLGRILVSYYYAKYFSGFRDLNLIKKRQYILLMLIMKRRLEVKGYVYLNQIITANVLGRVSTRTIRNSKFLEKIGTSSVYQNLVQNKYSSLAKMGKGDVIINLLSSIINTNFVTVDYNSPEKLGVPIEVNLDTLSEEFLDLVNQI